MLKSALGISRNTHGIRESQKSFSSSETFSVISKKEEMIKKLKENAKNVSESLIEAGKLGKNLVVHIKTHKFEEKSKNFKLSKFVDSYEEILNFSLKLFEELYPCDPLRLIGVRISEIIDKQTLNEKSIKRYFSNNDSNYNLENLKKSKIKRLKKLEFIIKKKKNMINFRKCSKDSSSKNKKMETKYSKVMSKICWICHQNFQEQNFYANQKINENRKFKPCLCKGSLSKIHESCLNRYVLQKYIVLRNNLADELEQIDYSEEELKEFFIIKCPNCKFILKYQISEKFTFNNSLKLNFKENKFKLISLFILIFFQLILLMAELFFLKKHDDDDNLKNSIGKNNNFNFISQSIHFVTVVIILGAAFTNFFDILGKETICHVLNGDPSELNH